MTKNKEKIEGGIQAYSPLIAEMLDLMGDWISQYEFDNGDRDWETVF